MKTNFSIISAFFLKKKIFFITLDQSKLKIKIITKIKNINYFNYTLKKKIFVINKQNFVFQNWDCIYFFWNRKFLFFKESKKKNIFFSIEAVSNLLKNEKQDFFTSKNLNKKINKQKVIHYLKFFQSLKNQNCLLIKKINKYFFFELKNLINLNSLSNKIYINCIEKLNLFNIKNQSIKKLALFSYKTQNHFHLKKNQTRSYLLDVNSQYAKSLNEKLPILIKRQIASKKHFYKKKMLPTIIINREEGKTKFLLGNEKKNNLKLKLFLVKKKNLFNTFILNLYKLKELFYEKEFQNTIKFLFVNLYGYFGLNLISKTKNYKIKENFLIASYIVNKSKNNFNNINKFLQKNLFYYDTDMFFSNKILPNSFINFKLGNFKLIRFKTNCFAFIQKFRNYIIINKKLTTYILKTLGKNDKKGAYLFLLDWKFKNYEKNPNKKYTFIKNKIWNYKLLYKTESSLIR